MSLTLPYGGSSQTVRRDYKGVREQLKGGGKRIYYFFKFFLRHGSPALTFEYCQAY